MKNFFLILLGMIGVVAAGGGTYFYLIDGRLHRVLFEVDGDLQTMSLKDRETVLDLSRRRLQGIPDNASKLLEGDSPIKTANKENKPAEKDNAEPPARVTPETPLPEKLPSGPSKPVKELEALAAKALEQFKTAEAAWEKNRDDTKGLKPTLAMLKDFLVRAKKERKALKPDEWQAVSERAAGLKAEIFAKHFASGLSTFNLAISKDASLKKLRDECRDLFNDVMNENK